MKPRGPANAARPHAPARHDSRAARERAAHLEPRSELPTPMAADLDGPTSATEAGAAGEALLSHPESNPVATVSATGAGTAGGAGEPGEPAAAPAGASAELFEGGAELLLSHSPGPDPSPDPAVSAAPRGPLPRPPAVPRLRLHAALRQSGGRGAAVAPRGDAAGNRRAAVRRTAREAGWVAVAC